jgi:zinc protease
VNLHPRKLRVPHSSQPHHDEWDIRGASREPLSFTHRNQLKRTILNRIICAAIGLTLPVTALAQSPEPWKQIPIPPLHAFKPTEPRRIELPNGLVIFLQEDHELPFIDGSILIRGGSRDEPAAKVGLTSLYGQAWRTSGTAAISGDALDEQLASKAATIETGGGLATTSLRWSSLKGDFDYVFTTSLDLLLHPVFKEDKLQLAKAQMQAGISRRNDDASGIASREASILVYGPKSPYGRDAQYATVDAVTLADFKTWHDTTVVPNNPASTPSIRPTSISPMSSSSALARNAAIPTSTPSAS